MAETIDPLGSDDDSDATVTVREKAMGFLDHLEELRWTFVKCLTVLVLAFVLSAVFFDDLKEILRWPLDYGLRNNPENFTSITNTPMAIFSVYIAIPAIGAITVALPFILFFIGQFISPALNEREKRLFFPVIAAAVFLFLAGALFAFFLLVPSVIRISVEMNVRLGSELLWSIDKYYSMLMWMVLGLGAAFQFPLIIQVLVFLDLVSVKKLRSWRRIMIVVCCVLAAIITPTPDPINMMIVAVPLYVLYEVAIIVAATYTVGKAAKMRG